MVPHKRLAPAAARTPLAARPGCEPPAVNGAEAEHDGRSNNCQGTQHHLGDIFPAGAFQLSKQKPAPKNSHQRVGIPEGKGNGETDIANGEDREGVGYGPQHPSKDREWDQVHVLCEIGEDLASSLDERRNRPARGEDARNHAERDCKGRKAGVDQFCWRLGCAEPDTGSEPADHPDAVH